MAGSSFQPPINLDPTQEPTQQIAFINQNFQNLASSLNPFQISDGSNNLILLGKDSAGNYVLKIANAGFNAYDAADSNLAFNSSRKSLQIVASGTVSIGTASLGTGLQTTLIGTANYTNTLNTPIVLAYVANGAFKGNLWGGTLMLSYTVGASITVKQMDILTSTIGTTSTTFTVVCNNATGGTVTVGGYNITYFVLTQSF